MIDKDKIAHDIAIAVLPYHYSKKVPIAKPEDGYKEYKIIYDACMKQMD